MVFERVCTDYLIEQNAKCNLPFLFTSIGRWWGTNPSTRSQVEIDLIASDGRDYLIGESKWSNEKLDLSVLEGLKEKAENHEDIILVDIQKLLYCGKDE